MAAEVVDYINASERMVGAGHGVYDDTLNRALRDVLTKSGYDPDAAFTGLSGPVFNVLAFDGATADVRIQAAIDALPAEGGVVDARGLTGAQTLANPITVDKPVYIRFGITDFTANNGVMEVTSDGVVVEGVGGGNSYFHGTRAWSEGNIYGIRTRGVNGFVCRGIKYEFEMTGTTGAVTSCWGIMVGSDAGLTTGTTNFLIENNDISVFGVEVTASQRYLGIMAWSETDTFPALIRNGIIQHNILRDIPGRCIEPALTENVVIANNVISNGGVDGTIVSVGIRTIGNKNLTVVGNSVEITGAALANSDGIQVDGDNVSSGVTIVGNTVRSSALAGTGIKLAGNASHVNCSGNTVTYDGAATTNMFGILVTYNPPSTTLNGASMPTENASMIAVHDNLVSGFVAQLAVKRALGSDPYPVKVSFCDNHLGPMWDGTAALGNFMDFPTAEVLTGDILVRGNWVPSGVAGMVEQFLGVVRAPAIQAGLTSPAQSGEFRLASGGQLKFRNNADSGDIVGLSKTTSDIVQLGASGAAESQLCTTGGTVIARARSAALSPGANGTPALGETNLRWKDVITNGLCPGVVTKTSGYTLTASDYTVLGDASGGAFNLTLPSAASHVGRVFVVKKIDSSGNAVTIVGTVDGVSNPTLAAQWDRKVVQSSGTAWHQIG